MSLQHVDNIILNIIQYGDMLFQYKLFVSPYWINNLDCSKYIKSYIQKLNSYLYSFNIILVFTHVMEHITISWLMFYIQRLLPQISSHFLRVNSEYAFYKYSINYPWNEVVVLCLIYYTVYCIISTSQIKQFYHKLYC